MASRLAGDLAGLQARGADPAAGGGCRARRARGRSARSGSTGGGCGGGSATRTCRNRAPCRRHRRRWPRWPPRYDRMHARRIGTQNMLANRSRAQPSLASAAPAQPNRGAGRASRRSAPTPVAWRRSLESAGDCAEFGIAAWGVATCSTPSTLTLGAGLGRGRRRALELRRREIDALNVFPVADADTGTNLAVDDAGGQRRARRGGRRPVGRSTPRPRCGRWPAGAALAARGNSGVIMAELLRGLADGVPSGDRAAMRRRGCGAALDAGGRRGLRRGRRAGRGHDPVGGPARPPTASRDLPAGGDAGRGRAPRPRRRDRGAGAHPEQLAVLAEAGVVDAGGRGLVVVLDALVPRRHRRAERR